MSTHETSCVVCGESCYCYRDEHALGCGGSGCYGETDTIDFCSLACFNELRRRMDERLAAYNELIAGPPEEEEK